ncbi:MAG TPA: T9SS type A sorting domain-containing protein, partial [bacterium]
GYVRIGGNLVELDNFVFTKLPPFGDQTGSGMENWLADGNAEPGQEAFLTTAPDKFVLVGASPNPFNPTTTICFTLPEAGKVKLAVFNLQGRPVATLVDGFREAGEYQNTFDANTLTSGVYLARLQAGDFSQTQKLVLMK